jgi:hypothetical protein
VFRSRRGARARHPLIYRGRIERLSWTNARLKPRNSALADYLLGSRPAIVIAVVIVVVAAVVGVVLAVVASRLDSARANLSAHPACSQSGLLFAFSFFFLRMATLLFPSGLFRCYDNRSIIGGRNQRQSRSDAARPLPRDVIIRNFPSV